MVVHTNRTAPPRSHPIGEVKPVQAQSVVRSVRTCEAWVMTVLLFCTTGRLLAFWMYIMCCVQSFTRFIKNDCAI